MTELLINLLRRFWEKYFAASMNIKHAVRTTECFSGIKIYLPLMMLATKWQRSSLSLDVKFPSTPNSLEAASLTFSSNLTSFDSSLVI